MTAALQLEPRSCPLCGPSTSKALKYAARFDVEALNPEIFSARRSPDRIHFQLMECSGCGIIMSDPACSSELLGHLYDKSTVTYQSQEADIYDSYAPILDQAVQRLSRRDTFVEIGGGRGFMLEYGAKQGFRHQVEVEPSSDAAEKFTPPTPNAKFIHGLFLDQTLPEHSADLICFFQMLDHVPDPRSFLQNVLRTLKPGGVAVCVTHNTQAVSARVLGEKSPIFDIEHTFLFHPENLERLFTSVGFNSVSAFPVSNSYRMKYWARMAPLGSKGKAILQGVFADNTLGNIRLPVRAGNFAVIASKP